jgi:quercetin dioxygenase-like cupin family protein
MQIQDVPFTAIDWDAIAPSRRPGATGTATWRTVEKGNLRVRMVEYSPGYAADHWCRRGHVLLVLDGELQTELDDGTRITLTAGMSYQVADEAGAHRSSTVSGARLFIVD